MDSDVGVATFTLKSNAGGGGGGGTASTFRIIDAVADSWPLTPWTTNGKFPVGVEFVVVRVRIEVNGGVFDWGLKTEVTPTGVLSRLSWTVCE